jgi:putative transposase
MSRQTINLPEHVFTGCHGRGRIPHCDTDETLQSITFRLADSLPREKLALLEQELEHMPEDTRETERRKRIESWLDKGIGCCALAHPEMAKITRDTLLSFNGRKYQLFAWCVMPTHVHVLILQKDSLSRIVQSWKSFTGRWAMANNDRLRLGVTGKSFWMRGYWDRYIRNEEHFYKVLDYIHNNPVKAGLCRNQ